VKAGRNCSSSNAATSPCCSEFLQISTLPILTQPVMSIFSDSKAASICSLQTLIPFHSTQKPCASSSKREVSSASLQTSTLPILTQPEMLIFSDSSAASICSLQTLIPFHSTQKPCSSASSNKPASCAFKTTPPIFFKALPNLIFCSSNSASSSSKPIAAATLAALVTPLRILPNLSFCSSTSASSSRIPTCCATFATLTTPLRILPILIFCSSTYSSSSSKPTAPATLATLPIPLTTLPILNFCSASSSNKPASCAFKTTPPIFFKALPNLIFLFF